MSYLFLVLLKINLVLILFAITYYLVLRKLTFYILNRLFLLFGIVFSTAYPFINLTEIFKNHDALPAFVPGLNQNVSQLVQLDSVSVLWQILTIVFYCGVAFMTIRLAIQFISLYQVHKKSKPGLVNDLKVRMLTDKISPFSFWQNIYINPTLHKSQDLNNIIEHEKIHVEELHTLDIIIAEISLVFYWFNPGVWLMKKAVKENIEFITDNKILEKGIDKKVYQYSLLDAGTLQNPVAIINNFNLSDLKKRIKMMNVKRSSKLHLSRYAFILPVIVFVSLAFTIDKKDIEAQIVSVKKLLPNKDSSNQSVELGSSEIILAKTNAPIAKAQSKPVRKKIITADSAKKFSFVFKTTFETTDSSSKTIANELSGLVNKAINKAPKKNIETKVLFNHFIYKDTLKAEPAMVSMFLEDLNSKKSGKSLNGMANKVVLIKAVSKSSNIKNGISLSSTGSIDNIDYYIDGEKVSKDDFKKLDFNEVQDIKMVKNSSGAIHVTTKQ